MIIGGVDMLEIIGAVFIIIVGTLLHFLYDWTNHNKIVAYFSAVNESTWEHIKLVIGPSFLWLMVEYHFYYEELNFAFAKFIGLLVMCVLIPVLFYTYKYFLKKDVLFLDISIFIVAVVVGQYVFHLLLNMSYSSLVLTHIGLFGLVIIFLCYMMLTFVPKKNFLHKDPISKEYGIPKEDE